MFSTKAQDNHNLSNASEVDELNEIIRAAELKKRQLLEGPREIKSLEELPQPRPLFNIKSSHSMLEYDDDDDEERLKLMVIGHGRHGKDTVCEILNTEYGYKHISSSLFCAKKVMFPISMEAYRSHLMGPRFMLPYYPSVEDCYEDRHNHRSTWYEAIKAYNEFDPAKLGNELYSEYDIYCGIRNKTEFHALKNSGSFDVAIWVDRSDHIEAEDASSCTVEQWMADYTIDNNGDLGDLTRNIRSLMDNIHSLADAE